MAGETIITLAGNLTADPELRFTQQGTPVANLTVASTPRQFDRQRNEWVDGETLFMRCTLWKELAEHASETLTKGMRVLAQGRMKARTFQTKEGENRTVTELEVDEIGPSLRYATAKVQRIQRGQQQGQGGGYGQASQQQPTGGGGDWGPPQQPQNDPWAQAAGPVTTQQPQQGGGWGNAAPSEPPF